MNVRKCLVSAAVGPAIEYWKYTLEPMQAFANKHDYDTCFDKPLNLQPPSWGKIPLLLDLLNDYDEVLWLDADILIVNNEEDVKIPSDYDQGLVYHLVDKCHTHGYLREENGFAVVPNCGVWLLRKSSYGFLEKVLALYDQYKSHPWWEQGAVIELLKRDLINTYWLDPKWNRHLLDQQPCGSVSFWHATACGNRLDFLRSKLSESH